MNHALVWYCLLISGGWERIKIDKLPILVKSLLNLPARVRCRVLKPFLRAISIGTKNTPPAENRFLNHSVTLRKLNTLDSYKCKMFIFWQTRKMINPFVNSVSMNQNGMFQPVAKKARMASSPKVISTKPSPYYFTVTDLQKCLFNASAVHPVGTQDVLVKKKGSTCFCK